LCRILHPSAATSPLGSGNSPREPNLVSMGGDATSRLVFEPETVKSLLPNEPERSHARGKKITSEVQGGTNSSNARN
jgi:hypothetical protein